MKADKLLHLLHLSPLREGVMHPPFSFGAIQRAAVDFKISLIYFVQIGLGMSQDRGGGVCVLEGVVGGRDRQREILFDFRKGLFSRIY